MLITCEKFGFLSVIMLGEITEEDLSFTIS